MNFGQTFRTVLKPMTFRVLFVMATFYDLDIYQIDIKMAFFYRDINQLLYIILLKSYYKDQEQMVCRLNKALYGLKQSHQLWYKCLFSFLFEKLGLFQINADHNIFITYHRLNSLIASTFVDNIKIMGPKGSKTIEKVRRKLITAFEIVDMQPISFYLGLKVKRN